MERRDVEHTIGTGAFRVDDVIRPDLCLDDREKRFWLRVWHGYRVDLASTFQEPEHRNLGSRATRSLALIPFCIGQNP